MSLLEWRTSQLDACVPRLDLETRARPRLARARKVTVMSFGTIRSFTSLPSARALGVMALAAVFGVSGCGAEDYDEDGALSQPQTWSGSAGPATTGGGTTAPGTTSGVRVVGDMPEEVRLLDGDTGGGTTGGGAAGPGGVNYEAMIGAPYYAEDDPAGAATAGTGGSAGTNGTPRPGGDAVAAIPVEDLSDGQIVFVADTLNAGEVDQARAALPQLTDEATRAFAQRMIDEHGLARDDLLELAEAEGIPPEPSDVATALREQSETVVAQLVATDEDTADALYVETQITAHLEASALLDALIGAADAQALQMQLATLHTTVQEHLAEASALSSEAGALE
jgi:putative membrane protein